MKTNNNPGNLRVGDLVVTEFHYEAKDVVRRLTAIKPAEDYGSGYRASASAGYGTPEIGGHDEKGVDAAWFLPAPAGARPIDRAEVDRLTTELAVALTRVKNIEAERTAARCAAIDLLLRAERAEANREDMRREAARIHDRNRDLEADIAQAEEQRDELRAMAKQAYEMLLGDTDKRAWHSDACYRVHCQGSFSPCICGLDDALAKLREMWEPMKPGLQKMPIVLADEPTCQDSGAANCALLNTAPQDEQ